jgi:AsmA protein
MMEHGVKSVRYGRLRWYLLAVVALVTVAVVGVRLVDFDTLRPRAAALASDLLGLEVTIDGAIGLRLTPMPQVVAGQVRLDHDDAPVARVDEVRLRFALVPLLTGETRVTGIDLVRPDIRLVRDADGRFNLGGGDAEADDDGSFSLSALDLIDATLTYVDQARGSELLAQGCDLTLPALQVVADGGRHLLARIELQGEIGCDRVTRGDLVLTDVATNLTGAAGRYTLEPVTATVLGGRGSGSLGADFTADPPGYQLDYRIDGLQLDQFMRMLAPESQAAGQLDFTATLTARGTTEDALTRSADGTVSVRGSDLTVNGIDLDQNLANYQSTQEFSLLDAGALILAGPVGLVVTKGYDYTGLIRESGGTTRIRTMISDWRVSDGGLLTRDVALATELYRLAATGRIDLPSRRFDGFTMAIIDTHGCAVVEQEIVGTLDDPGIKKTSAMTSMFGPLSNLIKKGIETVTGSDCTVFYDGAVPPS